MPRGATGVERVPDDFVLPPSEALIEAQRLLDDGRSFQAHEVLEGTWKASPPGERELWRGLAQLAVGLTHLQRGNAAGAMALLRRAGERIGGYAADPPYGVAAAQLASWSRDAADRLEQGDTTRRDLPRLCA